jgi:hypothetical protein
MNAHQQGQYYDEAAFAYDNLREQAEAKLKAEQDSIQNAQAAVDADLNRMAE